MKNFAIQQNARFGAVLMFTLMSLFVTVSASAQKVKASNYKALLSRTDNSEVQKLVSSFLPTVFMENGKVTSADEGAAISVESDAASFSKIASIGKQGTDVQILKIRLSDKNELNSKFDLSSLNNLPKLKYIYVICPFEAQETQISNMFMGTIPTVTIIYSAAIPN